MSAALRDPPRPFDAQAFRLALGRFPTGVCIVTTRHADGEPVGITVSSFNSVSLDPPLILWSLRRSSPCLPAFAQAGRFALSVLADDQAMISNRFASPVGDRFAGVRTCAAPDGLPLIDRAAAHFACTTWAQYDGGDHLIFVGEVGYFAHWRRSPLVFAAGSYDSLVPRGDPLAAEELWPIALG